MAPSTWAALHQPGTRPGRAARAPSGWRDAARGNLPDAPQNSFWRRLPRMFRRRGRVRNLARHHLCRWRTTLGHRTANLSRHLGLAVHPAYNEQRRGWSRLVKLRAVWARQVKQLRCRSYSASIVSHNLASLLQHLSVAASHFLFVCIRHFISRWWMA